MFMGTRIIETMQEGSGPVPKVGDKLVVHYSGCLASTGRCFDSSRARGHAMTVMVGTGRVIKGWDTLLLEAQKGVHFKMFVTAQDAYGAKGSPPSVPPNADLVFDVEVLAINETLVQERIRYTRELEELKRLAADEEFLAGAKAAAAASSKAEGKAQAASSSSKKRKHDNSSSCSESVDSSSDSGSSGARAKKEKKKRKKDKKDRKKESKKKHKKEKKPKKEKKRHHHR